MRTAGDLVERVGGEPVTAELQCLLDALRGDATDERDKGDKFEVLVADMMRASPMYRSKFSDVWLWSDWPDKPASGRDLGIDIVAVDAESGQLVAVQCKFRSESYRLQKSDIDSFLAESGKDGFVRRVIATTANDLAANLVDTIRHQQIPVTVWDTSTIASCGIDWSTYRPDSGQAPQLQPQKQLRPHQRDAIDAVVAGWESHDRGKLVMACGTGKTFTALRLAEETVGPGGMVLFTVPSSALMDQTLTEWMLDATVKIAPFTVCSDVKIGKKSVKGSAVEDSAAYELLEPATTDPERLFQRLANYPDRDVMRVVLCTYQSLDVVAAAQRKGLGEFDVIICDEAHRTTGVTLAAGDESSFVKVHDNTYVASKKRVYMTATPRMYGDNVKSKAAEADAVLCSMDDETVFGPEFHRLGFGAAVDQGLLCDYKVLVLSVDEGYVAATFQRQLADAGNSLKLDDAARIVGCWNALAKNTVTRIAGEGFPEGAEPMRRAVAFTRSIPTSKALAEQYSDLTNALGADAANPMVCDVAHVDGTMNATKRREHLSWLKSEPADGTCRILSNVRCLSEGVDVPALDAVLFLSPRNSQVDVVQSVGRVMRKAPGKELGYIILPVVIPVGMEPHRALEDDKRYEVVWKTLQALRSIDDRFDASVNQIEFNKRDPDRIGIGHIGDLDETDPFDDSERSTQLSIPFAQYRDAILARIVRKVGQRTYWAQWADDVRVIAEQHIARITQAITESAKHAAFERFLADLQQQLNPGITAADAIHMLAQHIVTRPVFDALFGGYEFTTLNPVSQTMQAMVDQLEDQTLSKEAVALDAFYDSVRTRAEGIDNHEGRQAVITELYEQFFKKALPKTADAFGIVYTPLPVVDWMINAVNYLLKTRFNADLSAEGVQVLDPFTGTGTFIVRILQSGLVRPADLARKYASELHANELLLLAYYIAAINIEATYHQLTSTNNDTVSYQPFEGIVLTDTFQLAETVGTMDAAYFPENRERVQRQQASDIRVILGNPPYSAGQTSENDNNQNQKYPAVDQRITDTYVAKGTATNKNSLYDSYYRAFRWAADRLRDTGIVAFVSNGGWIDSNSADGFRLALEDEFDEIWVYNLRGNARTSGEQRRKESGNVFESGSRATVAITLLVRSGARQGCTIRYRDVGDYLTREQKLKTLADIPIDRIEWTELTPNTEGDWINQRRTDFDAFQMIGDPANKTGQDASRGVFSIYSNGVVTSRDAWSWNFSCTQVLANSQRMIGTYNDHVAALEYQSGPPEDWIDQNPANISWTSSLKSKLIKGQQILFRPEHTVVGCYRPFCKQFLYFDNDLIHRVGRQLSIYPHSGYDNWGISLTGAASHYEFTPLATSGVPDFHVLDTGQLFPRYRYDVDSTAKEPSLFDERADHPERIDNIAGATLQAYRARYGHNVTCDDVFSYVYGILHSPQYRGIYAADLKRQLPRIPMVDEFREFADAGQQLADLHVNYEQAEPYPLDDPSTDWPADHPREWLRVQKMRFRSKTDRTAIVFNSRITLSGIPEGVFDYMVGPRSAIEWIIDRYQVRTHKDSGIVNDPNDWCDEVNDPRYIVDLIKRIVTVSLETNRIVASLPPLNLADEALR